MRHTWMGLAGALLLAGCGVEARGTGGNVGTSQQAAMDGGGMDGGGMGGGGGMDGMDPECMGMGGGGMAGGGMGGGGMGGGQLAMLGRMIFCDTNLSDPPGQSCAACHSPDTGFTGAVSEVNRTTVVYPGAANTKADPRFGNRKPPAAAYATPSPELSVDEEGTFSGGLFWDGRATGWRLHDPAAEQALGPFLNPMEQNLSSAREVVAKVCGAMYGQMFRRVAGAGACSATASDAAIDAAYDQIGRAISAFEASPMVNRYSSRYDRYLRGEAKLTPLERKGLELFKGKGKCADCHPADLGPNGEPPLLTDNTFDNLGLPPNPQNPATIRGEIDLGLGDFLRSPDAAQVHPEWALIASDYDGAQRVPPLRNVDKRPSKEFVKAFGHNGYFKSLEEIVHFYNTRDVLRRCEELAKPLVGRNCWPAPEVDRNVNTEELGNLGLKEQEEAAIVAFLKTLSDE